MVRAGVFVGVDQTGSLQKLNDAAAGARRMHAWALSQGLVDKTQAILITDGPGKLVRPDEIYDAIKSILDGPGVDQLIVYFAGHGVNINRGEQWLLSEAPVKTSAAVNLKGSVELAQYCGINHVVFISDACRVAPDTIQASNVRGTEIFPNESSSDISKPVDQFFACGLGKTAAEIRDAAGAASNFSALYTDALLTALNGEAAEAFKPEPPSDPDWYYVGAASLRHYLAKEIPRRVLLRKLAGKVNQSPDAIVIDSGHWVSRIARASVVQVRRALPGALLATPRSAANSLINSTIAGVLSAGSQASGPVPISVTESVLQKELSDAADAIVPAFGPDHFETECGIKVRGAEVVEVFARRVLEASLLDARTVRVGTAAEDGCVSVLLRFDTNTCAIIPAIHGYLAALTFDCGELVDVAYEPATTNRRWDAYQQTLGELRRLRSIIAAATENGYFRLENVNAHTLARRMQYEKSIDPTLAVYAAYAYHDLQRKDIIREMCGYLRADIGATLFDLELLGRRLVDKQLSPTDRIVPFFPMLSQGWALLNANRFRGHPMLPILQSCMRSSLWTLFGPEAFETLKNIIDAMEIL